MPAGGHTRQLGSWKEIADYPGVSVRTAQKWERERGLPVRRLPGEKGRVAASTADLDQWRPVIMDKPGWWASLNVLRAYAAVTTAVVLLAAASLGVYFVRNRRGQPARFALDGQTLIVADESGKEVWRKTFDEPFEVEASFAFLIKERDACSAISTATGRLSCCSTTTSPREHPEAPPSTASPRKVRSAGDTASNGPFRLRGKPSVLRTLSASFLCFPPRRTADAASPS